MEKKFRFHVLGLSHAKTAKEYSCDAFSQKVRLICKMLTEAGHTVFHYGTEGSDVICTEHISVLSNETFQSVHGQYDWKKSGFLISNENPANLEFNKNAIAEISKRKMSTDFLLCSFGVQHQPIARALAPIIPVELGIGYRNTFAKHRIFESYGWMHFIYGTEERSTNPTPNMYDAVIPNYYDLNDYIYSKEKDDYFFFIARPTILKGLEIAARSVEAVGGRLVVAGQGEPPIKSPVIDFIGVVSIEERAKWISRAKATFVPTIYTEPFGGTAVESLLGGTPVITTDYGAFPETVPHGRVGYRCRTLEQFIWATKNINKINPEDCRRWAVENYSMDRVREMYEEYFDMLYTLYTTGNGWYQYESGRTNLDWLNKKYV